MFNFRHRYNPQQYVRVVGIGGINVCNFADKGLKVVSGAICSPGLRVRPASRQEAGVFRETGIERWERCKLLNDRRANTLDDFRCLKQLNAVASVEGFDAEAVIPWLLRTPAAFQNPLRDRQFGWNTCRMLTGGGTPGSTIQTLALVG